MGKPKPPAVTTAALHKAFADCRKPDWPTEFDAAMHVPMMRAAIWCRARQIASLAAKREAARQQVPTTRRKPMALPRQAPQIDLKRRASGDTDD